MWYMFFETADRVRVRHSELMRRPDGVVTVFAQVTRKGAQAEYDVLDKRWTLNKGFTPTELGRMSDFLLRQSDNLYIGAENRGFFATVGGDK